jgi:hypothetical protein
MPADPRRCGPARSLARFRRGRSWPAQPPGSCAGCCEGAAAPARPPRAGRAPFATRTGACGSTLGGRARASRDRVGDDGQAPGPEATSCRPPAQIPSLPVDVDVGNKWAMEHPDTAANAVRNNEAKSAPEQAKTEPAANIRNRRISLVMKGSAVRVPDDQLGCAPQPASTRTESQRARPLLGASTHGAPTCSERCWSHAIDAGRSAPRE